MVINKLKSTGLYYFDDPKAFIDYSSDIDDIYKNIEEYNPNKKRKILILFDDMIADMPSHENRNSIAGEGGGGQKIFQIIAKAAFQILAKSFVFIAALSNKEHKKPWIL